MTARRKIAFFLAGVFAAFFIFVVLLWSGVLTPSAPAGWAQIHVGMGRDAVLSLAGEPQATGWPEKIAETWERKGLICRHRLFVIYHSEKRGEGYVESVWEGTWLRGYGWLHPRKEPR